MSAQHDDDIHEGTPGYKLSQPKQSLAAYQEMVSINVPAPPPSSPYCDDENHNPTHERGNSMIMTAEDIDVLMELLRSKTNSPVSEGAESDQAVADEFAAFTIAPSPSASPAPAAAADADADDAANGNVTNGDATNGNATNGDATNVDATNVDATNGDTAPGDDAVSGSTAVATPPASPSKTTVTACQKPGEEPEEAITAASNNVKDHVEAPDQTTIEPTLLTCPADAGDESLQRYKESLGLGGGKSLSNPNDPRVCIIKSLTLESPGRDPVTIDLSVPGSEATLKDHPFTIKEGSKFTMVATFMVQHEVLSGLRYVQVVKRKGVRVSKDSEMLGSYAPSTDKQPLYTKRFQEEEAPSGMLARGHYVAYSTFVDDDKKTHLAFDWSFDIAKDW
ncbi:rho GDP dissociation inhibitor [Sporothrix bragantina]|uniref:Rho GDP dissociation inhibitor n=1 Tax=Sporothrix bragantina TaxID=671064 RepID=A0ABP0BT88_9PEZI